uniref:ATP synthase protein 8 n=1 Tax=Metschnikowia cubensis TaxID=1323754 RepID=A0A7D7D7F2_9ASCO|nr:Atp8 [Metschnikowia cubensis]QMJ95786.1 Atp8 [Metschnikowia cubensis]QMJ95802.1 Atp8 [Metschnikowia cubensis]
MPQLVPFYFLHLLTFGIFILTFLIFITSKFLLPNILKLLVARILIIKL